MFSTHMIDFAKLDPNEAIPDNGESVQISGLALLKMLRHGKAGIPLEVMGLMLGSFVDEHTIVINDVYSMPQTGTGVTVEAVDPVYQAEMTQNLALVNKNEDVVGWYHSHPGFGCWLSSTDMSTQESFERLHKRAIAVVIDPIQSVKGKVVIDAFRLINNQYLITGIEPRQVTSNMGFLSKPSVVALLHGLNRHYYCFRITFRKSLLEQNMLRNMNKKPWESVLTPKDSVLDPGMENDIKQYVKSLADPKVAKVNYRRRVLEKSEKLFDACIVSSLLKSIHRKIFS